MWTSASCLWCMSSWCVVARFMGTDGSTNFSPMKPDRRPYEQARSIRRLTVVSCTWSNSLLMYRFEHQCSLVCWCARCGWYLAAYLLQYVHSASPAWRFKMVDPFAGFFLSGTLGLRSDRSSDDSMSWSQVYPYDSVCLRISPFRSIVLQIPIRSGYTNADTCNAMSVCGPLLNWDIELGVGLCGQVQSY